MISVAFCTDTLKIEWSDSFQVNELKKVCDSRTKKIHKSIKTLTIALVLYVLMFVVDLIVVGKGHNMRVQKNDPTADAEIECLRNSSRIGTYSGTVLFSKLMPCYMCPGAVVQFGIKKVVVGESRNVKGANDFMQSHGIEVTDLDSVECVEIMRLFILNNPALWNEDIGKK